MAIRTWMEDDFDAIAAVVDEVGASESLEDLVIAFDHVVGADGGQRVLLHGHYAPLQLQTQTMVSSFPLTMHRKLT